MRSLTICAGAPAHRDTTRPRFEVRELGEIDMVSRARDVAPEFVARSLHVWRASKDAALRELIG